MIEIRDLSFSYGSQPVLDGITFQIKGGGLSCLLGRNGAGKTTLFRCMLGLEPFFSGDIMINGQSVRQWKPVLLASQFAYIPQSTMPVFSYSVLETVLMGTARFLGVTGVPGASEKQKAMDALDRLGLSSLASRPFQTLSGGERRLTLIARALAQNAHTLIMDEPDSSLDFGNQAKVLQVLHTLTLQGYSILMSTHNPQHALQYADRVLGLSEGKLICDGDPNVVLDDELLSALYRNPVHIADTPWGKAIL